MANDLTPILREFSETNKNINMLATSINNLSNELKHSNANIKRIEEKEIAEIKGQIAELERKEDERVLKEARQSGVEEVESKQKAFLVANWHKLLITVGAAAPMIVYVTDQLKSTGVIE